jgi:O-antigen ligase
LRAPPSRAALDRLVPGLAAATVVAFAAGSSSIGELKRAGLDGRWVVLGVLAAISAAWAPRPRRLPAAPLAAAGAFVGLALVSSLWSIAPRLSAGRAISLAVLFAAAVLLAAAARESPTFARRVLLGLLWGAAIVALLGVVVLAVSYGTAVVSASIEAPARYRGFGENPNTASLLLAVTLPLAVGGILAARDRTTRVAAVVCGGLFAASVIGSGSRGAVLAAAAGTAVVVAVTARTGKRRLGGLAAVGAGVVLAGLLQALPQESATPPASPASSARTPQSAPFVDVERVFPLDADVGRPLPGGGEPPVRRAFFAASGRMDAWRGAIAQAAGRPLLGFGFGTEGKAFVDRYYAFFSDLPENSYIGIALQLGVVGLAGLLGLVATLVWSGRRQLRARASPWGAACLGVAAAGLAIGFVQSYLYSVGNIATATFWIAAFMLPALAEDPAR